jgi:hypothetical protein
MTAGSDRGTQLSFGSAPPAAGRTGTRSETLRTRFPARRVAGSWPQTVLSRQSVLQRLGTAPFVVATPAGEDNRRRGVRMVLDWLQTQPGDTWQRRWLASGAASDGRIDWRSFPVRWRKATTSFDCRFDAAVLGTGLLSLMCADVIRPGLAWVLTTATPKRLAAEMARTRDPVGFAELTARCETDPVGESTTRVALHRIAAVMAAKGGAISDITIGDCLELLGVAAEVCTFSSHKSPYFYQLLHTRGGFDPTAAPTVRALTDQRQLSVEQLVDRCGIACRPVRDLLVDYLAERQVSIDHVTLVRLADTLGRLFWRDLELQHPGIDSLHLAHRSPQRGNNASASRPPAAGRPTATSSTFTPLGTAPRTACPRCGRSISTSPSGQPMIRHGGDRGPCPARSRPGRSPTARRPIGASPASISEPANAYPCCPP